MRPPGPSGMNQELLRQIHETIKDKGENWVIAAMVDGSIGYYSPCIAARMLQKILKDGRSYSERGMCCYGGDGLEEVSHDISCLRSIEARDQERVRQLVLYVQVTRNVDDFAFNAGLSCAYPTNPP